MAHIIEDMSVDHLIPAEAIERWRSERALWEAKLEAARAEYDQHAPEESDTPEPDPMYHDYPYDTERIKWREVAQELRERAESHPGAWIRVQANAKTSAALSLIRGGGRPNPLTFLEVQGFARSARPRSDGQPVGWEIYMRIRPE